MGGKDQSLFNCRLIDGFWDRKFIHDKLVFIVGAPPYELPGELFWTYCTSIIFMAAAFGIIFSKRRWGDRGIVRRLHFFYRGYILRPATVDQYLRCTWVGYFSERYCDERQCIYFIKGNIESKSDRVERKYSHLIRES